MSRSSVRIKFAARPWFLLGKRIAASYLTVLLFATLSGAIANANPAAITPIQQCTLTGTEVFSDHYSPTLRPQPETDGIERWISFVDVVFVFGPPSGVIGEVWLGANRCFGFYFSPPRRLLGDPALHDSYLDPEWSPDGRFLAYTKTDASGTNSSVYIQEFERDLSGVDIAVASTPVGAPMLVADGSGGIHHRHPTWNPDGTALAFDSDMNQTSINVYSVDVDPSAQTHGSPVQRTTTDEGHAEFSPSWSPDGTRIAYMTNALGLFQIAVLNLATSETILFPIFGTTRANPAWSRDGNFIYFETASLLTGNPVIAKIQVDTGEIQELSLRPPDPAAPTVSRKGVLDPSGALDEYVAFSGQGPGGIPGPSGTQIWRAQFLVAPPARASAFTLPPHDEINLHSDKPWCLYLEAVDLTFDLTDVNPTTVQLLSTGTGSVDRIPAVTGKPIVIADRNLNGIPEMPLCFAKEDLRRLLSAITKKTDVPLTCQGNLTDGRRFSASLTVEVKGGDGPIEASVYPNPFNPAATLTFHTRIPGPVTVSVFDLTGRRVYTLLDRAILPVGYHDIAVDGSRARLASGVYFYRIDAPGMVARGRFAIAK